MAKIPLLDIPACVKSHFLPCLVQSFCQQNSYDYTISFANDWQFSPSAYFLYSIFINFCQQNSPQTFRLIFHTTFRPALKFAVEDFHRRNCSFFISTSNNNDFWNSFKMLMLLEPLLLLHYRDVMVYFCGQKLLEIGLLNLWRTIKIKKLNCSGSTFLWLLWNSDKLITVVNE